VAWVAAPEAGLKALRALGIAAFRGAEPAIDAVAAMVAWGAARRAWQADAEARTALAGLLPAPSVPQSGAPVPTVEAAALLGAAGVPLAAVELAEDADRAVTAAERLGWPVVMKIESPDILHKTEVGGVAVGLADADAVREAWTRLVGSARAHAPEARIAGVVVQAMGRGTVEMVIGVQDDPVFGPVVMVGFGGILVEVLADVTFARAPVTEAQARAMLDQLRGRALLDGVRGAPPVDRGALAALIASVSRFAAANAGRIASLDLNPVLAGPDGAVAVDWLLCPATGEGERR
jgi:acetate---CoA ligase (ADP-forming)